MNAPKNVQRVNLFVPMEAVNVGPPPIVIPVNVTRSEMLAHGAVPARDSRVEHYVLLSALPDELRERVKTAVQALLAGR